jgi:uncharacterized protein (TIGR02217 family)
MSNTDILTLSPEFGIKETINFHTAISETESGIEHRAALWDAGLRDYDVNVRYLSKAAMDEIWAFYIARKGSYDFFLLKIETEFEAIGEHVGNADGAENEFILHHFPVDTTANHSCLVDDVVNSDYILSNNFVTEKSSIVFNTPPVGGQVLVTYEFYLKVRFSDDNMTKELVAYQLLHASLKFKEVRWNDFVPPNGNSSSSSSSNTA